LPLSNAFGPLIDIAKLHRVTAVLYQPSQCVLEDIAERLGDTTGVLEKRLHLNAASKCAVFVDDFAQVIPMLRRSRTLIDVFAKALN